jgi:hypothetical protein
MPETDYFVKFSTRLRRGEAVKAMKGAPLAVWLVYALHVGRDGCAWPSVETVSKKTGYSIRCVQYAIKKLILLGALAYSGNHHSGVKRYRLPDVVTFGTGTENVSNTDTADVADCTGGVQNVTEKMSQIAPEGELGSRTI